MMYQFGIMICPHCNTHFGQQTNIPQVYFFMKVSQYMNHLTQCKKIKKKQQKEELVYEKIPNDDTYTTFEWHKKAKRNVNPATQTLSKDKIKSMPFQQKQYWFRSKLQSLRISWTQGADYIKLDKENILMGSLNQVSKIDLHKEVKVQFIGEKVNDAGGLLREWVHMILKEIFDFNTGIFTFANTQDVMYSLKWDEELDEHFSSSLLFLLGIIIGKAIFERIPVNCFLDRTIIRQICNQSVELADIYGYDKELYKNWKKCLQATNIDDLDVYFVTYRSNGEEMQEIELLQGHKDIKVDNDNKKLYIQLLIQTHTVIHVKRSIANIIKGIKQIFPIEWLQIFQPHEMQMILYGIPYIDIHDWYDHTLYKEPYSKNHQVIKWFWKIMEDFDQEQLGKVLHFCTGSTRTPIHGFSRLQSNRGNYSKFLIVPIQYSKKNPYPKAHTCFNRLELPQYPNQNILKTHITAISKNQMDGIFGLD